MKHLADEQDFWDENYRNYKPAWDLKSPTPVFKRILNENKLLKPGKLLIPGSGYGYDAVEAAKAGFEVTAVDFSISAIKFAEELAYKENVSVNFLSEDFFTLASKLSSSFDAIFDYVTFCAINPVRREEYAKLISGLLKCGGTFIALWFPVEEREGGPPFAINLEETQEIFSNHLKLQSSSADTDTIKPRRGREILQIYKKEC